MVSRGFPWLTMRENPAMGQYHPRFVDLDKPDASVTMVRTPSGAELDVTDSRLATELGHGAQLLRQGRGIFDALPLSLITTQTVTQLGSIVGLELDVLRFRPNIVVDTSETEGFREDDWVGCVVRIRGMSLRVDDRVERLVMV